MSEGSSRQYSPEVEEQLEAAMEFIARAGAIGILREIDHTGGKRFTDLDEVVPVSSSTLTTRLGEAVKLGILVRNLEEKDGRTDTVYEQTKIARRLRQRMQEQQLIRIYDELRDIEQEFDEEVKKLQEWTYEELPYVTGIPPANVDIRDF